MSSPSPSYRDRVDEAASFVAESIPTAPEVAVILGTGLEQFSDRIDVERAFAYGEIPHFPSSTVESHEERLVAGTLRGRSVLALEGRSHLYEGYSAKEVAFPVRVLGVAGVETLLISNSAGGMDPHFERGNLMLITDHVNLQADNPLIGPNVDDWGPRFPDMSEPYDPELRRLVRRAALREDVELQQGVYVGVTGPHLETRAEYRFLRTIGGDAVGMSTVPEVLAARHMDLRVCAVSVITDECLPDALEPLTLEDALAAAREADPKLSAIFEEVVANLPA